MFGFVRRYKAAKIAQRDLIAAFENRGKNFLVLPLFVNEALVKEAMMTGIEATLEHFDRMEMFSFRNRDFIVQHYRERAKKFGYEPLWQEFEWLPDKLVSMWVMGVKAKHEKHGWGSMPGILWDVDTMTLRKLLPRTVILFPHEQRHSHNAARSYLTLRVAPQ
jgi:hypothetical protein